VGSQAPPPAMSRGSGDTGNSHQPETDLHQERRAERREASGFAAGSLNPAPSLMRGGSARLFDFLRNQVVFVVATLCRRSRGLKQVGGALSPGSASFGFASLRSTRGYLVSPLPRLQVEWNRRSGSRNSDTPRSTIVHGVALRGQQPHATSPRSSPSPRGIHPPGATWAESGHWRRCGRRRGRTASRRGIRQSPSRRGTCPSASGRCWR
jgi:hypothetical protein